MHYRLISDLKHKDHPDSQDRGLHYGDGLFETMLLSDGTISYWQQHYERLSSSARQLGIGCPAQIWFDRQLQPYFDLQQDLIIKILLTRGSGGRGLSLPDDLTANVYLLKYQVDLTTRNQPLSVAISGITLPENKNLAGLKHLNRLDYVLATRDLAKRKGFNEALLQTESGHLVEGIVHNLFFVKQGRVYTPALDSAGVDGIMRQQLLKYLNRFTKEVKIGRFSPQDVLSADECFLCNSVQGIRAVRLIEDTPFHTGPLTQRLQQEIHDHSGN